jgi:hypothetical protein
VPAEQLWATSRHGANEGRILVDGSEIKTRSVANSSCGVGGIITKMIEASNYALMKFSELRYTQAAAFLMCDVEKHGWKASVPGAMDCSR